MLWFFEREQQSVRLETRYDNETAEYLAVATYPDGREETERFTDNLQYQRWLEAWQRTLEADHWIRRGPPIVLPDGWPKQRPLK